MKRIAFLIVDNGEDGRAPDRIVDAFWDEAERDRSFEANSNKAYLGVRDIVVDVEKATHDAYNQLNGLNKLLLGLKDFTPPADEPNGTDLATVFAPCMLPPMRPLIAVKDDVIERIADVIEGAPTPDVEQIYRRSEALAEKRTGTMRYHEASRIARREWLKEILQKP